MKILYGVTMLILGCVVGKNTFAQSNSIIADTTVKLLDSTVVDSTAQIAKSSVLVQIADINIQGNNKTKSYIIQRELGFKPGEQILLSDLEKQLEESKKLLINTTLFSEASVYIASRKDELVFINVEVKERWYIFPLPYFKIVDRNFNQWWVESKRSLDRVNYGIKFTHNNFSGRRDRMYLSLITGYHRQINFNYYQPYADRSLKHGFGVSFIHSKQREMPYGTDLNKQLFLKQDNFIRTLIKGELSYYYRPAIKTRHTVRLGYTIDQVADTIQKLNTAYWDPLKNKIHYPELTYTLQYFDVDYIPYPSSGFMGSFYIQKRGINKDMNVWQVGFQGNYTKTIFLKSQLQFQAGGTIRFPFNQPYYNQLLFGYGDLYMRGLEYYVIDGVAGIIGRVTARREILAFTLNNPVNKFSNKVPFKFLLKAFGDAGYTYSRTASNSLLSNKFLRTCGVGLDIITIYDFVLKLEYSFNQLGNNGLFLHSKSDF